MHPCRSLQKTWRLAFPEPRTPSMRSSKLHLIRACSTNLHSCHGSLIQWPNVMCTVSWQKLHPNMGGRHVEASTARFLRDCRVAYRPSAGFHSPHALHMLRQALPGFFVFVLWGTHHFSHTRFVTYFIKLDELNHVPPNNVFVVLAHVLPLALQCLHHRVKHRCFAPEFHLQL